MLCKKIAIIVILSGILAFISADQLEMKSGTLLIGKILEESEKTVRILTDYGEMTIDKDKISRIRWDDGNVVDLNADTKKTQSEIINNKLDDLDKTEEELSKISKEFSSVKTDDNQTYKITVTEDSVNDKKSTEIKDSDKEFTKENKIFSLGDKADKVFDSYSYSEISQTINKTKNFLEIFDTSRTGYKYVCYFFENSVVSRVILSKYLLKSGNITAYLSDSAMDLSKDFGGKQLGNRVNFESGSVVTFEAINVENSMIVSAIYEKGTTDFDELKSKLKLLDRVFYDKMIEVTVGAGVGSGGGMVFFMPFKTTFTSTPVNPSDGTYSYMWMLPYPSAAINVQINGSLLNYHKPDAAAGVALSVGYSSTVHWSLRFALHTFEVGLYNKIKTGMPYKKGTFVSNIGLLFSPTFANQVLPSTDETFSYLSGSTVMTGTTKVTNTFPDYIIAGGLYFSWGFEIKDNLGGFSADVNFYMKSVVGYAYGEHFGSNIMSTYNIYFNFVPIGIDIKFNYYKLIKLK